MGNTRSETFSIRLKPATKKKLTKLAKESGRSANFLISDAVEAYVQDQQRLLADLKSAEEELASGHYIPHDQMKAWLLSWGTEKELPPPRCICGRDHGTERR